MNFCKMWFCNNMKPDDNEYCLECRKNPKMIETYELELKENRKLPASANKGIYEHLQKEENK